ncbi:MAG: hypothetical protein ACN4G0_11720 [Polyangiales bacterium]
MARNVLFLLGIGSIGWAMVSLFFGSIFPEWTGLGGQHHGQLYIEALATNVGLWTALGAFALAGAMFQRLRLAATLAFLVCAAGFTGGRILALVQGARPEPFTVMVLALEVAMIVAASAAYISEKTRIAREARELKKAEKAALEAALAAEHAIPPAEAPSPSPVQQP